MHEKIKNDSKIYFMYYLPMRFVIKEIVITYLYDLKQKGTFLKLIIK